MAAAKKKATKKASTRKRAPKRTGLGDVARSYMEKHVRPLGGGKVEIPGWDEPVRASVESAVDQLAEFAASDEAPPRVAGILKRANDAQACHDLRAKDNSLAEIAESVGIPSPQVNAYLSYATEAPIRWKDKDELAEKIVSARDDDLEAWAGIAMRAGVAASLVRKLYSETSGTDFRESKIRAADEEAAPKPKAKKATAKKKAPAKKAPAKKKATTKASATPTKKVVKKKRVAKKRASA